MSREKLVILNRSFTETTAIGNQYGDPSKRVYFLRFNLCDIDVSQQAWSESICSSTFGESLILRVQADRVLV